MRYLYAIPLLLSLLVGLIVGLIGWGFWQGSSRQTNTFSASGRDDWMLGLLVLAVLALGIFFTYALLGFII